ncbi:DUF481 domain-containing protein [Flavitalea flava]
MYKRESCILKICFFCFLLFSIQIAALAQKDTVIVRQGDILVGEIKSMVNGIVLLKTPYSPGDIAINWNDVLSLRAERQYRVSDSKGRIFKASVRIDSTNRTKAIFQTADSTFCIDKSNIDQVVEFVNPRARDRLTLKTNLGYTATKSDGTKQFSFGLNANYKVSKWDLSLDVNAFATQSDSIKGSRGDLTLSEKYILPHNWFFIGQSSLFYSSEQDVSSRFTQMLGTGFYLRRKNTNKVYIYAGFLYNREKFTVSDSVFNSAEAFAAMTYSYNIFKRIDIASTITVSPSLTESGRLRSGVHSEISYELSDHFNIGIEYTLNTDSKPPLDTKKNDYIYDFTIGWKL